MPNAKTMFGNYRRSNWRLREFYPKLYRGKQVRAGPWNKKPSREMLNKYHKFYPLVKIRGGAWIVLEDKKARAENIDKHIRMRQAGRRAADNTLRKLSRM